MPRSSAKKKPAKVAKVPTPAPIAPPVEPPPAPSAAPSVEDEIRKIEAELPPAPPPPPPAPGPDAGGELLAAVLDGDPEEVERKAGLATPADLGDAIELLFWGWGKVRAWWVGRRRQLTAEQRRRLVACWNLHPETRERLGRYLLRTLERHGVEVTATILGDLVTVGLLGSAWMHHADAEGEYLATLPTPTQVEA